MVESRNVISFHNQNQLLDEGTLLVLKMSGRSDCGNSSSSTNETNNVDKQMNLQYNWMKEISNGNGCDSKNIDIILPIGKILEVFGPVSKPLYTVRLLLSNDNSRSTPLTASDNDCDKSKAMKEGKKEEQATRKEVVQATRKEVRKNSEKSDEEGDKKIDGNNQGKTKGNEKEDNDNRKPTAKGNVAISPQKAIVDPWSENGVLTNWIGSNPKLEVYYTSDQVKFVDTQSVARNSRKGCGK